MSASRPSRPSRTQTVLAAGGLTALLAAGSLAVVLSRSALSSGSGTGTGTGRIAHAAFSSFSDCDSLLDYYRGNGWALVGPYGLPGSRTVTADKEFDQSQRLAPPVLSQQAAGDGAGSRSGSSSGSGPTDQAGAETGTNVQVAGVDEADVAKRSGDLLLTVGSPQGWLRQPVVPGLRILRATGDRATLLGVLPTTGWTAKELVVHGRTVLLLGPAPYRPTAPDRGGLATALPWQARTRIAQVDITDPAHPRLVRTLDVDGSAVGARLSGGMVRLAVSSPPGDLNLVKPAPKVPTGESPPMPGSPSTRSGTRSGSTGSSGTPSSSTMRSTDLGPVPVPAPVPTTEAESLAATRKLIMASSLDDWLPRYTLTEAAGGTAPRTPAPPSTPGTPGTPGASSSGRLLDCAKVAAPSQFSGLDTLSLLTFDLRGATGIASWDGAGVVTTGSTMYATAAHTYVATAPWQDWAAMPGDRRQQTERQQAERQQRTWIHAFATDGTTGLRYLASGSVPGTLLNRYSLDEYRGDLRVASTLHPTWLSGTDRLSPSGPTSASPVPGPPKADSSQVTVLRARGDQLTTVGSVSGIGRGERIYGVRFIGPVGYVVTFRRTDPLFTVDLSDPARPRVAGELKLLGYSAYLHPAGEGLLLGIGQAADGDGRREGLQLSLFDVSNPAAPRRLSQVVLPGAVSDVESDVHAFAFADQLALIPYSRSAPGARWAPMTPPGSRPLGVPDDVGGATGVIAVRVAERRLSEPTVLHPLRPSSWTSQPRDYRYDPQYRATSPLRVFVHRDAIWTVTHDGVATHQESTLRWLGFTRFAS